MRAIARSQAELVEGDGDGGHSSRSARPVR
jgi:hypothetical protein